MTRRELFMRGLALLILVGLPTSVLARQWGIRLPQDNSVVVVDLFARAPEMGGWSPEIIEVTKGDRVRLRVTAEDVVHGFAIAGLSIDAGTILPGEVKTVEFVADQAGRFTFYCNVWCSPYHYRMRGTLVIVDPNAPQDTSPTDSLHEWPALDIDSPHLAPSYPSRPISLERGELLAQNLPASSQVDVRRQSPSEAFEILRRGQQTTQPSEEDLWSLVAYLWLSTSSEDQLATWESLYGKNCVGCHGRDGDGTGPGSPYVQKEVPDFTAPQTMAGGTGQIYFLKIRRGGMGTGMPYFGSIFSEEETWDVVAYLWTFLFPSSPGSAGGDTTK